MKMIFNMGFFMRPFLIAALLLGVANARANANSKTEIAPDWSYVEKRLKKEGFSASFRSALKENYETAEFKNVLELNVVLFLKKTDYHAVQVTPEAVERIRGFIEENQSSLRSAESAYGVPAGIIASLLWIESRYGSNLGRHHVGSVYAHLVQADRPDIVKHLQTAGAKRFTSRVSTRNKQKIAERTKSKAKWAIGELRALSRIHDKGGPWLPMRGSFAGAFGLPQFLPSSYLRWAKSEELNKAPDLTTKADAIQSVAFYLKSNGWHRTRTKTHKQALLNYNKSEDYARAIMKLAEQVKPGRGLASGEKSPPSTAR